jgi:hypothetical protein
MLGVRLILQRQIGRLAAGLKKRGPQAHVALSH